MLLKHSERLRIQRQVTLLELILQDQDAEIHFQAAAALFEITGKGYGYNRL